MNMSLLRVFLKGDTRGSGRSRRDHLREAYGVQIRISSAAVTEEIFLVGLEEIRSGFQARKWLGGQSSMVMKQVVMKQMVMKQVVGDVYCERRREEVGGRRAASGVSEFVRSRTSCSALR